MESVSDGLSFVIINDNSDVGFDSFSLDGGFGFFFVDELVSNSGGVFEDGGEFFKSRSVFGGEDFFEVVKDGFDIIVVVDFGDFVVNDVIDVDDGVKSLFGFFMSFGIS